ncbi:MAG TPA: TRAP transporter small permease [Burkholderiales bacterium]|nr:TRAP transporter small permease [Burkholderiales bacterium]
MPRFDRAVAPALGLVAAALMLCLMLLTCVDVVGRYFFNTPVTGGFEMTELLLAALIFAGLPLVTLRSEHIVVDLLDPVTPHWLFRAQHVLATLIGIACTGYLAWRLGLRAEELALRGETTSQLGFRLSWLTWAMSLLMALTAAALVATLFRPPQRHFPGESEGPGA